MKINAAELYSKAEIKQNEVFIKGKAYKIVGFDFETQEFDLMEKEYIEADTKSKKRVLHKNTI